tara:strand:+ start:842 stop:1210 length:369 start_codon:yes stop_codon:yes gene_type:complete
MTENNQYPSISEQGSNLARFVWNVLQESFNGNNDSLLVSDEVYDERMEICRSCEYYDDSLEHHNLPGEKIIRCKHCGCWLTAKARMSLDSCPIDKWSTNSNRFVNEKFEEIKQKIDNKEETN